MNLESHEQLNKRFEISKDQTSRERIAATKETYQNLKKAIPEVNVSFSLFGSLSKGKELEPETAAKADVDLYCFFDSEDVMSRHDELYQKYPDFREYYKHSRSRHKSPLLARKTRFMSNEEFINASDYLYIDAAQGMISRRLYTEFENRLGRETRPHLLVQSISYNGLDSILNRVKRWVRLKNNPDEYSRLKEQVANCFHLDVGGGLRKYRRDFLLKLKTMDPKFAEEYWKEVDYCVRGVERGHYIPQSAEHQFPQTLDEALKYYGVRGDQKENGDYPQEM